MKITFKDDSHMNMEDDGNAYVTICEGESHSCVHLSPIMFGRLCIAIREEVF